MTAANISLPPSCFAQEAQRPPLGEVPDAYLSRLSPLERSLTLMEEGGTQGERGRSGAEWQPSALGCLGQPLGAPPGVRSAAAQSAVLVRRVQLLGAA